MAVKADELIRKPFQPHDLILRIKNLLNPRPAVIQVEPAPQPSSHALSTLFSQGSSAKPGVTAPSGTETRSEAPPQSIAVAARALATQQNTISSVDAQKLRNEIQRLQLLLKKLQAEIEAERQYSAALEAHFKTLQES